MNFNDFLWILMIFYKFLWFFNIFLSTNLCLCYWSKIKGNFFPARICDMFGLALDWWRFHELWIFFSLTIDARALEYLCHFHCLLGGHSCETIWARDLVVARVALHVTGARIVSHLLTDRTLLMVHLHHQQTGALVVTAFAALRALATSLRWYLWLTGALVVPAFTTHRAYALTRNLGEIFRDVDLRRRLRHGHRYYRRRRLLWRCITAGHHGGRRIRSDLCLVL